MTEKLLQLARAVRWTSDRSRGSPSLREGRDSSPLRSTILRATKNTLRSLGEEGHDKYFCVSNGKPDKDHPARIFFLLY